MQLSLNKKESSVEALIYLICFVLVVYLIHILKEKYNLPFKDILLVWGISISSFTAGMFR